MKAAIQKKSKSLWDKVKQEDRDFFFNYLNKKVRNWTKKLKDIADLEEEQEKGERQLKPDQIQKIQNKDEVTQKIQEFEKIAQVWIEAKKEQQKEKPGVQIHEETLIVLLQQLSENQSASNLILSKNESTYEVAKQLNHLISGQNKKQDGAWAGLQGVPETTEKPVEQAKTAEVVVVQPEPVQVVPVVEVQPQEHFVLVKVTEKQSNKKNRKESEDAAQQSSHKNSEHFKVEKKERKESHQYKEKEHKEVKQKPVEEEDDGFVTVESKHKPHVKFNPRKGPREHHEPREPREPREQKESNTNQKESRNKRGGRRGDQEVVYVVKE